MSVIKEIVELAKDSVIEGSKVLAIKRALRAELKLNTKIMHQIERMEPLGENRRKEIIEIMELISGI